MRHLIAVAALCSAVTVMATQAQAESKGEQVFKEKCTMCHVVKGKGGAIGPELTKVGSRMKDKDIRAQLENPKKLNPSSSMPSFKTLPAADMDALIGFLKTLK